MSASCARAGGSCRGGGGGGGGGSGANAAARARHAFDVLVGLADRAVAAVAAGGAGASAGAVPPRDFVSAVFSRLSHAVLVAKTWGARARADGGAVSAAPGDAGVLQQRRRLLRILSKLLRLARPNDCCGTRRCTAFLRPGSSFLRSAPRGVVDRTRPRLAPRRPNCSRS